MTTLTDVTPPGGGLATPKGESVSAGRPRETVVSVSDSVARGALANVSAQPLTWAASFLIATAVPRFLGSEALGEFTLAVTITTLGSTALGLGISDYLTRRVAQKPDAARHDIGLALVVQTIAALLGALVIAFFGPYVAGSFVDSRLLGILLIGMVAAPAQGLLLAALRGREKHVRYAWLNAIWVALVAVGSVLVLAAGGDVFAFAAVGVGIGIAVTLFNWKVSGVSVAWPSLKFGLMRQVREMVRSGFPFLSWNLTLAVYGGIDRLLLGALVPASEVGWYAAAYRIIGSSVFIPTVLVTPLFPVLSRNVHEPVALRLTIAQTLRVALLCTVPLSAGIIVVAPIVPTLLGWPADFANAVTLMVVLSLHLPVVAVDMVLGTVIMAIGREARWVRVGLVAAVFNIAANWFGIPFFEHVAGNGAIGASVTTVLTEILMSIGAVLLIPRHLLDPRMAFTATRIFVAGAATVAVGTAVLPMGLAVSVAAGVVAYVVSSALLRTLTLQDLHHILQRFHGRNV